VEIRSVLVLVLDMGVGVPMPLGDVQPYAHAEEDGRSHRPAAWRSVPDGQRQRRPDEGCHCEDRSGARLRSDAEPRGRAEDSGRSRSPRTRVAQRALPHHLSSPSVCNAMRRPAAGLEKLVPSVRHLERSATTVSPPSHQTGSRGAQVRRLILLFFTPEVASLQMPARRGCRRATRRRQRRAVRPS
jgi:hypothetical protein